MTVSGPKRTTVIVGHHRLDVDYDPLTQHYDVMLDGVWTGWVGHKVHHLDPLNPWVSRPYGDPRPTRQGSLPLAVAATLQRHRRTRAVVALDEDTATLLAEELGDAK